MLVLALDLATSTGWAMADSETYELRTSLESAVSKPPRPESGFYEVPKRARGNIGAFLDDFEKWLRAMISVSLPTMVAFEAPLLRGNTSIDTARKLMALAAVTEMVCYRADCVQRCFEANNATVRKHFIRKGSGKRDEIKRLTIIECEGRGWNVQNDDEADALALLDYAMHCFAARGQR